MNLAASLLSLAGRFLSSGGTYTSAVILAAGSGSRMAQGQTVKQLRPLLGIPVAVRSLLSFEACPDIHNTVLVTRKADIPAFQRLKEEYALTKLHAITEGGETRLHSAAAGLLAVSEKSTHIAVHDAARCLVSPEDISRAVKEAQLHSAATLALPVYDTVKRMTPEGYIEKTLPRDRLALTATPQVFSVELYRAALYYAVKEGLSVTDDNQMLEAIGQAVKLVFCRDENFKITTEADLLRAEELLRRRERP